MSNLQICLLCNGHWSTETCPKGIKNGLLADEMSVLGSERDTKKDTSSPCLWQQNCPFTYPPIFHFWIHFRKLVGGFSCFIFKCSYEKWNSYSLLFSFCLHFYFSSFVFILCLYTSVLLVSSNHSTVVFWSKKLKWIITFSLEKLKFNVLQYTKI